MLLAAALFVLPFDAVAHGNGWRAEVSSGKSGSFAGRTSQGEAVSLTLSGRGLKFRLKWSARCDDGGRRFSGTTFNRRPARLHGGNLRVGANFKDRAADGVRVR